VAWGLERQEAGQPPALGPLSMEACPDRGPRGGGTRATKARAWRRQRKAKIRPAHRRGQGGWSAGSPRRAGTNEARRCRARQAGLNRLTVRRRDLRAWVLNHSARGAQVQDPSSARDAGSKDGAQTSWSRTPQRRRAHACRQAGVPDRRGRMIRGGRRPARRRRVWGVEGPPAPEGCRRRQGW
jgi:hypothetical protein